MRILIKTVPKGHVRVYKFYNGAVGIYQYISIVYCWWIQVLLSSRIKEAPKAQIEALNLSELRITP